MTDYEAASLTITDPWFGGAKIAFVLRSESHPLPMCVFEGLGVRFSAFGWWILSSIVCASLLHLVLITLDFVCVLWWSRVRLFIFQYFYCLFTAVLRLGCANSLRVRVFILAKSTKPSPNWSRAETEIERQPKPPGPRPNSSGFPFVAFNGN